MDPQQAPMNPRFESPVLPNQPAGDWAKSTQGALSQSESTSLPGQKNPMVQHDDLAPDTSVRYIRGSYRS